MLCVRGERVRPRDEVQRAKDKADDVEDQEHNAAPGEPVRVGVVDLLPRARPCAVQEGEGPATQVRRRVAVGRAAIFVGVAEWERERADYGVRPPVPLDGNLVRDLLPYRAGLLTRPAEVVGHAV